MEKLERVRRTTYRRMEQIDSQLERFEERPERDTLKRYSSLHRRFEEVENLLYRLQRKHAPDPYQLIRKILTEHSTRMIMQSPSVTRGTSRPRVTGGDPATCEYHRIPPALSSVRN